MQEFSQSLVGVTTFTSNILFWQQSAYFDTAAYLKPLLHTWSLAVEEQFYILFPKFILLAWQYGRMTTVTALVAAAILSLGLAQWGAFNRPAAAFFLLPTRAWELLIGVLVAFYFSYSEKSEASERLNQSGSLLGLMLIMYAILAFDKYTPFPGLYALFPT